MRKLNLANAQFATLRSTRQLAQGSSFNLWATRVGSTPKRICARLKKQSLKIVVFPKHDILFSIKVVPRNTCWQSRICPYILFLGYCPVMHVCWIVLEALGAFCPRQRFGYGLSYEASLERFVPCSVFGRTCPNHRSWSDLSQPLLYYTIPYQTILHNSIPDYSILHCILSYSAIVYYTILYCTVL